MCAPATNGFHLDAASQAQRQRLAGAMEPYGLVTEATNFVAPPLPPAGPGLVKAAMNVELVELRAHAEKLALALEQANMRPRPAPALDVVNTAEWRTRLELAVERERSRTGHIKSMRLE